MEAEDAHAAQDDAALGAAGSSVVDAAHAAVPPPPRPQSPSPPPPPLHAEHSERDGLLAAHGDGSSCANFHALEIQSDDGSLHGALKHPVAAAAVTAAVASEDPKQRLLPPPPGRRGRTPEALPDGITRRERFWMVVLFSMTAALLYAGAHPCLPPAFRACLLAAPGRHPRCHRTLTAHRTHRAPQTKT